jgi:hypothetical protein
MTGTAFAAPGGIVLALLPSVFSGGSRKRQADQEEKCDWSGQ